MDNTELLKRIEQYANAKGLVVGRQLGFGVHGNVYDAQHQDKKGLTAIKAHSQESAYVRERDVYLRLRDLKLAEIHGCNVPRLIGWDDSLWIIEMTIVTKPHVLDFGGAYLDRRPFDFSDEVMAVWHAEKAEQFGGRWVRAQAILLALEEYGIFVVDVNPNNIALIE